MEVEASVPRDGAGALKAHVHLAHAVLAEHAHHLRDVASAAAIRVDPRIGGVAGELDQQRPGREAHLVSVRLSKPASPRLDSSTIAEDSRSNANRPSVPSQRST